MLKGKLEGLRLSINDESIIEDLRFSGDSVVATIGAKDGPVCGPILSYEIIGDDSLVIDKDRFNIQWSEIKFEKHGVAVVRNGYPAFYSILSTSGGATKKRVIP